MKEAQKKLSCQCQQAFRGVPVRKSRGRYLLNRKISGAVPTHQRGRAALPFAAMGKRGTAGRAWRPVPLPLHIYPTPASRPRADTDAAVAGRTGP